MNGKGSRNRTSNFQAYRDRYPNMSKPKPKPMLIAVDFDGTCVQHAYPNIGPDIGAVPVLKQLVADGHKLILWTMRSGETLRAAVKWFEDNGIPLFGVNGNPTQLSWTTSPKAYAQLYIDDAAYGAPLVEVEGDRPYFDWSKFNLNGHHDSHP